MDLGRPNGLFRPDDRRIWRDTLAREGGQPLTLRRGTWSFDRGAIDDLMRDWRGPWRAELWYHYWFIVAEREG